MTHAQQPGQSWDPTAYHRFAAERRQPFDELLALVDPTGSGPAVDLGCGSGELTADLAAHLAGGHVLGIDRSTAMLERAAEHASECLTFEQEDIGTWAPAEPQRLVFSNAALHWLPDHPALVERLAGWLAPGGQLAFQVPANYESVPHRLVRDIARRPEWAERFSQPPPDPHVLDARTYAELLQQLGFVEQRVMLRIFMHELDGPAEVVHWLQSTTLTVYRDLLSAADYEAFAATWANEVMDALPDVRPFPFSFARILAWARWPGAVAAGT